MKLVFDNIDFTIVGHLQTLLEAEGIKTEIRNEGGSGAAGELPFQQVYPELWVVDNADEPRAKAIITDFRNQSESSSAGPDWTCPVCKEHVEGVFTECWNCGAANPELATD